MQATFILPEDVVATLQTTGFAESQPEGSVMIQKDKVEQWVKAHNPHNFEKGVFIKHDW